MPQQELSPLVQTFLAKHIGSLEQLQLLMRLVQSPDRWWDASTAAWELGMSEPDATSALDELTKQNLLDIRITDEVRYQFHPGTEELRGAATACAETFRRRPVAVLNAVTGPRRRSIRDFADAFRIRKDDDR